MQKDYICKQLLTTQECIEIRNHFFKNLNPELKDIQVENTSKNSDVYLANYKNIKNVLKKVEEFTFSTNEKYFGYDLRELKDEDIVILDAYDSNKNGQSGWRKTQTDSENFDFKLCVFINLSDQYYDGGDLKILTNNGEQPVQGFEEEGSVCIMPSFIPHGINNVVLGVGKIMTQFYKGPRFK
jgi:hypothetical protein|tara:strand:+ start:1218 stop:1766 length:549 start_codon:yes stop_codon:yes gene_type:complete